jgi:uncharacterized membrane protein YjgN (DUF898 family)
MNRYFAQKSNFSNYTFDFKGKGDELFVLTLKGVFFTFLTCGIYLAWFLASYYNYMMNNTSFNGQKFKQKLDGGDFFANLIIAYLLIFFTLFIGIPWAMNRLLAFRINAVSYEGEIRIVKEDVDTSTGAEGEQFLDDAGGGFLPI